MGRACQVPAMPGSLASQLPVCPSFRLLACYFSVSLPLLSHLPLRTLPLSASQPPDNSRRPLCFSSGGPPGLAVLRGAASSHTCQQCINCPCVVALTATYKQGGKNLESHFPLIHLPFVVCPFLPSIYILKIKFHVTWSQTLKAQDDLEFLNFWLHLPKCWNCRHALPSMGWGAGLCASQVSTLPAERHLQPSPCFLYKNI